jgi:hypothetical protein
VFCSVVHTRVNIFVFPIHLKPEVKWVPERCFCHFTRSRMDSRKMLSYQELTVMSRGVISNKLCENLEPPPPDNPFSHIVTNVELTDLFFTPPPRQPFSQKTIVVIYGITVWSDDLSLVTYRILTESFTPPLIFTPPHRDLTLLALLLVLLFHLFFTPPTPFFTREGVHFL